MSNQAKREELREAIEDLWLPLFVVPWTVGVVTIFAISGHMVFRLACLAL